MRANLSPRELVGALQDYLEELQETGVDGLPWADPAPPPAVSRTSPGTAHVVSGEALDQIRAEMGDCQRCSLGSTRTSLVFGVGKPHARLVFVGEAPGRDEDLQGEPFVGEAGQLLTKIILAMGFARSEVYICNILKCRPPGNRNPLPVEIEACHPFLLRQLQAIKPAAIVCLGTFAAQTLLATREPISKLRGSFHDYHGIPLMPTFHPAYLLRNAAMKREVWADMQLVMKLLGKDLPPR
jgi:DNA polymerase